MKIPVVVPFLLVSIYRVRSDCRSPFAWMPDPSDCNQFYLCSNGMQFKYACPENTVADIINKACVPRGSTFDKCYQTNKNNTSSYTKGEYSENHCTKSHCFPCSIRFPSCRGLPDGLNPWNGREGSPYFAICKSQRVVLQGKCSYEENSDEQIFDSRLRVCVKVTA
ncbi:unnamed protein product [Mytilus coruscus]|uniref:Chitin-binding type-2 domain-containing protein n=1 Tax=Mytilus coruscus TaxID=42192 RepID=A0A6J8EF51_MYTCO|nr:unnamed protein product [Mytilus coruscus]